MGGILLGVATPTTVDLTGGHQLLLDHFKVLIQVIFGDLAGRRAIKQSSRRSFPRGHVHVAHPYQRNLPLIPERVIRDVVWCTHDIVSFGLASPYICICKYTDEKWSVRSTAGAQ